MYRKKIFFCLLQVMLNYRTNDITNSTFLYTEHIKPFSRKHMIHKIQNEGMSHDAQTIKSTAKIKKNKSHHMKSSFAAQVSLWKKKILTTRTDEECTCFDVWLKNEIFSVFTVWYVLWMTSGYHNLSVHEFYFFKYT